MSANDNSPTRRPSSRAAVANRIDCVCDAFESEILLGRVPRIEDFLREEPEEIRPRLFKELLLVELEHRRSRGEEPRLEEYHSRFPSFRSTLLGAGLAPGTSADAECELTAKTIAWQRPDHDSSRFQFIRILGSGAFGAVWLARDQHLDRTVAVKVPLGGVLTPREEESFLREARAAAQLRHPNIVQVYDAGREENQAFIVSEFIEGATLKSHRETRKYTPSESAQLCALLADALEHAHQRGVIHRDLKPGNILIDADGEPHITDFGLAKRETADATWTRAGEVFGTPAYMSPEQARGDSAKVDGRSDVYSLGVILYELLVGERPFSGESHSVIFKTLYLEPVAPRKRNSRIPRDLETICLKAMAKRPPDRYPAAAAMAADLRRFLAGECVLARRIGLVGRAWRWARRRPKDAVAAVLGLVALAAIVLSLRVLAGPRPSRSGETPVRAVSVTTTPPGAELAFFPRDPWTGEPMPQERNVATERSPARVKLPPGDYLVVAKLDERRFHEVFRRIPDKPESVPGAYRHLRWTLGDDGSVHLPEIKIPDAAVVDGMARIEGTNRFAMGKVGSTIVPRHHRRIPSFWIDTTEVSLGDYRAAFDRQQPAGKNWKPVPDNYAVTETSDSAITYAETVGKRLPTEAEYEYAATSRGRSQFPWGEEVPAEGEKEVIGPVGTPAWDRLDTQPPVFGLASNVAEWTSTWRTPYPPYRDIGFRGSWTPREYRIVRGGDDSVIAGDGAVSAEARDPRNRQSMVFYTVRPGLGFRCVRSAKPRWNVEDFEAIVSTAQPIDAAMR